MQIKYKNILVPFDNSKSSQKALEMAIIFAKKCDSRITLVHVVVSASRDKSDLVKKIIAEKEQETGLEFLFLKHTGRIHIEVVEAASNIEADLIIMGTHGATGIQEFWIGTNAYRVVSSATIPVITVREGVDLNFDNIVIPIDDFKETRQKVPMSIAMAKLLGSRIHVFETSKYTMEDVSSRLDRYGDQVAQMVRENDIEAIESHKFGGNITTNLLEYSAKENAGLIIMMSETEASTGLFLGSNAQQLVNHSKIPVMTLHTKDIGNIILGY